MFGIHFGPTVPDYRDWKVTNSDLYTFAWQLLPMASCWSPILESHGLFVRPTRMWICSGWSGGHDRHGQGVGRIVTNLPVQHGRDAYDTIIVGGGSAGCVLANRLSHDSNHRVLVLEAGRPDYRLDFRLHMPAALTYPLASRAYNWWYDSEPEKALDGRRVYQPRGKVLGGSSSINGMIFIRGHPLDYDNWARLPGLEHWSYSHVLPYFNDWKIGKLGGRLSG